MKRIIPFFDLIVETLDQSKIEVKPMFGHHCLYFDGKMVMYVIDQPGNSENGVCLATSAERIPALSTKIKSLRYLRPYGPNATNWRLIPADSEHFEHDLEIACKMIKAGSPLIGRESKSNKKLGPIRPRRRG